MNQYFYLVSQEEAMSFERECYKKSHLAWADLSLGNLKDARLQEGPLSRCSYDWKEAADKFHIKTARDLLVLFQYSGLRPEDLSKSQYEFDYHDFTGGSVVCDFRHVISFVLDELNLNGISIPNDYGAMYCSEIYHSAIEDSGLSVQSYKTLKSVGITTVRDLLDKVEPNSFSLQKFLLNVPGFSPDTRHEIHTFVDSLAPGLSHFRVLDELTIDINGYHSDKTESHAGVVSDVLADAYARFDARTENSGKGKDEVGLF
jgi:hypothetical protein